MEEYIFAIARLVRQGKEEEAWKVLHEYGNGCIATERERCAKVAKDTQDVCDCADRIADTIRGPE